MVKSALAETLDGLRVVRTWKRDGSQNVMSAWAAVANLARLADDGERQQIAERLLTGATVETPLALFRLATGESANGKA